MVEAGLVSLPVVEHFDVVEQDRPKLRAGEVFPSVVDVSKIAFERCPQRFHRGVDAPTCQECVFGRVEGGPSRAVRLCLRGLTATAGKSRLVVYLGIIAVLVVVTVRFS